jgi:Tol biopolymer transport system component
MRVNIPRILIAIVLLAAAGSWRLATHAQGVTEAERQLQKAILLETVDGNLQGAIDQYKKIVAQDGNNRATAAKALLRLAGCYEKLGQTEAEKTYRQLIADYADQTAEVTLARTRLVALTALAQQASTLPALRLIARITRANAPPSGSVSPDGQSLAYVNWDTGDLGVLDLRSGRARMVTNKGGNWETGDSGFMPRWSPDGKQLAYYWSRDDGRNELRVIDLSGKNVRTLRSDAQVGIAPVGWFPDAKAILAVSLSEAYATEILRVWVDDGRMTPLAKPASVGSSRVCLSPNGRYVAFDMPPDSGSLNMDVFVMPSSGGAAVPVMTGPHDDRLLDWTPDGRRILVASNRSGTYDVFLIDVDDGNVASPLQLLRKDLGLVTPLGFSPDGAFYFVPDSAVSDVMVVDWNPDLQRAASTPVPATEHFSGATRLSAWSHDGRKLAYVVDRGNFRRAETQVRIRDVKTGAERTLTEINGSVRDLSWSPDGGSVAVTVRRSPAPGVCEIVDEASGTLTRRFTSPRPGESIYRYLWGPEAGVAYYEAGAADHVSVLRRDLRTGEETSLYRQSSNEPVDIAISPDGRHVAAVALGRLLLIPSLGGEARELVRDVLGSGSGVLAFYPDGKYVYFGRSLNGAVKLYRVPAGGGTPDDLNVEIGGRLGVRPDGRQLAFTRSAGRKAAEVWVMENFLPARK